MTPKTLELEIELATEKENLRTSIARLGDRASDTLDWRQQFRRHPAAMVGAVMAAGVMLGAVTGGSNGGSGNTGNTGNASGTIDSTHRRQQRGSTAAAWERFTAGFTGMLADRALVVAQDLTDRFVVPPGGRDTRHNGTGS